MQARLFDTNILIDLLHDRGGSAAIVASSRDRAISVITRIEVLAGVTDEESEQQTRTLLRSFKEVPLSNEIAEAAALHRRRSKLKLPDAIILATAEVTGRTLVTRDFRDFRDLAVLVPYRL